MALKKTIRQQDGVTTEYHRVLFIQITPNRQNSVAVVSYVDGEARDGEKVGDIQQPYQTSITYETEYDPTMTVEGAYNYLKHRSEFEGAKDV